MEILTFPGLSSKAGNKSNISLNEDSAVQFKLQELRTWFKNYQLHPMNFVSVPLNFAYILNNNKNVIQHI